jgi:hypothetical protein
MVIDGFDDEFNCFETFELSHPKFYERNLGWDRVYKLI